MAQRAGSRLPGDARRAQIIGVARELFTRQGYRATTTRDLARAAGVSDALIYRYFAGKEEVLFAVVDEAIRGFIAMAADRPEPAELTVGEFLTDIGQRFLDTLPRQLDMLVLLIAEHRLLADDVRFATFVDGAASVLAAELEARSGGEVREGVDGYLLIRGFMAALVAFALLQQALGLDRVRHIEPAIFLSHLVTCLVNGIKPSEAGFPPANPR
jgi:AcrR family transcriptional regulator